jgi:hypothetical protein
VRHTVTGTLALQASWGLHELSLILTIHTACCCIFVLCTAFQVRHTVTGTLALLRSNHPEDCMSCDVNGKCEFQDLIQRYQVRTYEFSLSNHRQLEGKPSNGKCESKT